MLVVDVYGDLHRSVVQTMMAHGTLEKKAFESIFQKLWSHYAPNDVLTVGVADKVIDMINERIGVFDQKISTYEYGLTNDQFLVFQSTAKTSMSKMQNLYSEAELDFFKLILTKITSDKELNIAPREALNLSSNITGAKLNKLKAQKLLDSWIQGRYFFQHTDNRIYIGPKLLCEFKDLLQGMELDYIKSCLLCENVAVWGERCAACGTIYHPSCIQKFLSRSEKCPSCKAKWAGRAGPAAVESDED